MGPSLQPQTLSGLHGTAHEGELNSASEKNRSGLPRSIPKEHPTTRVFSALNTCKRHFNENAANIGNPTGCRYVINSTPGGVWELTDRRHLEGHLPLPLTWRITVTGSQTLPFPLWGT